MKHAHLVSRTMAGAIIAAAFLNVSVPRTARAGNPGTDGMASAQSPGMSASSTAKGTTPDSTSAYGLPENAARIAALRHRYETDPGFRALVADYNAWSGHPDRGETASLAALSRLAAQGAPMSALIEAVQPRPAILRALQEDWQKESEGAQPQASGAAAAP